MEGQEQPFRGTRVGLHLEKVFAVEQDLSLRDLIFVLAGDDIGQGRFAGAVRPHDGRDFAGLHRKGHALQDRLAVDLGVEIANIRACAIPLNSRGALDAKTVQAAFRAKERKKRDDHPIGGWRRTGSINRRFPRG